MNSFGRIFRVSIFGESHGYGIGLTIDGVLAGMPLKTEDFQKDIKRRAPKKTTETPRLENNKIEILSGIFNNKTTGAPLTLFIKNQDIDSSYYNDIKKTPREGHADLTAKLKYNGFNDYRGSGQFSGRMTIALVIAGVVAKKIIKHLNYTIQVKSKLSSLKGNGNIKKELGKALLVNKTIGGIIETKIRNIPIALGEPFFDSFESVLSHLIFSIPGIKGIDFDDSFYNVSNLYGEEFNKQTSIDGGLSNGKDIQFKVAVKPPASNPKKGRFDLSFAERTPVILESAVFISILDFLLLDKAINERIR